jgi:hypothetical protein
VLPFVAPKLSAIGYMREADTFATRLDRAIERSSRAKLIEARVEPTAAQALNPVLV